MKAKHRSLQSEDHKNVLKVGSNRGITWRISDLMTRLTDLKKAGGNSGLYLQKWIYSATMLTPRSSRLHSSVKISAMCCSFLLSSLQYALDKDVRGRPYIT